MNRFRLHIHHLSRQHTFNSPDYNFVIFLSSFIFVSFFCNFFFSLCVFRFRSHFPSFDRTIRIKTHTPNFIHSIRNKYLLKNHWTERTLFTSKFLFLLYYFSFSFFFAPTSSSAATAAAIANELSHFWQFRQPNVSATSNMAAQVRWFPARCYFVCLRFGPAPNKCEYGNC